jgi:hypothetical protein
MRRKLTTVSSLFIAALILISCKKLEGPKGDKGDPGLNGSNGNANVKEITMTVASSTWKISEDSLEWENTLFVEDLSSDIVKRGTVQFFIQEDNSWWPLPFAEGDALLKFGFQEKLITMIKLNSHHNLPAKPSTTKFRLVMISASQ